MSDEKFIKKEEKDLEKYVKHTKKYFSKYIDLFIERENLINKLQSQDKLDEFFQKKSIFKKLLKNVAKDHNIFTFLERELTTIEEDFEKIVEAFAISNEVPKSFREELSYLLVIVRSIRKHMRFYEKKFENFSVKNYLATPYLLLQEVERFHESEFEIIKDLLSEIDIDRLSSFKKNVLSVKLLLEDKKRAIKAVVSQKGLMGLVIGTIVAALSGFNIAKGTNVDDIKESTSGIKVLAIALIFSISVVIGLVSSIRESFVKLSAISEATKLKHVLALAEERMPASLK